MAKAAWFMTMRLAVLSRGPRLYSTRRIVEEARIRGLDVEVCDPMKFSLVVNQGSVDVLHRGQAFAKDAVIPRIGHSITQHGVAVLRHIEQLGIWTANTGQGIIQSRDKLNASQILARNRLPVPKTVYVRDILDVEQAIDTVGGLPVVVKVTQGTQGDGVFLRHTAFEVRNLVQGLLMTGKAVLVQEYIAESTGRTFAPWSLATKWWPACVAVLAAGNFAATSTSTARLSALTCPRATPRPPAVQRVCSA